MADSGGSIYYIEPITNHNPPPLPSSTNVTVTQVVWTPVCSSPPYIKDCSYLLGVTDVGTCFDYPHFQVSTNLSTNSGVLDPKTWVQLEGCSHDRPREVKMGIRTRFVLWVMIIQCGFPQFDPNDLNSPPPPGWAECVDQYKDHNNWVITGYR